MDYKCAKNKSTQPLWILGWGGLDDIAQALHDAPEIQNKIRIYLKNLIIVPALFIMEQQV